MGYSVQALIGVVALVFAVRSPRTRSAPAARPAIASDGQAFGLGITITAVEATTALPYLGALALIIRTDASGAASAALLVVYNLVLVAPPTILALLAHRRREQVGRCLHRPYARPAGRGRTVLRVLCGVIGIGLLVDSTVYFRDGRRAHLRHRMGVDKRRT